MRDATPLVLRKASLEFTWGRASGGDPEPGAPDPADAQPRIHVDLGRSCEWGGLVVDFAGTAGAPPCARWRTR